jgi:hypothetical protein
MQFVSVVQDGQERACVADDRRHESGCPKAPARR